MSHASYWLVLLVTIPLWIAISARPLAALPPPAPPRQTAPVPAATNKKADALEHFNKGSTAYRDGKWDIALAEFQEARQLYPGARGSLEASAQCFEKLERYPEALEAYETELREFDQTMPSSAKQDVLTRVAALEKLVGAIDIRETEIGATISVDGQTIGAYPLRAPLRVKTGSHRVRVYKEAFEPFEQLVEVAGGGKKVLTAPLKVLGLSGRLRVAENRGAKLTVVVDGDAVGETPWDGPLAVGEHTVTLRGEGLIGSQPASVTVKLGQRTQLVLEAEELTAQLRVEPSPSFASVAIDGATVGKGVWVGRVRAGAHLIEVTTPGFFTNRTKAVIERGGQHVLAVALLRDPNSPFWPKPPRKPRIVVDLETALTILPSFGGGVAGGCTNPCSAGPGLGGEGIIHGGYELASGLGFGVTAGLLTVTENVTRRETKLIFNKEGLDPDSGLADDRLRLHGVLLGGWGGWSFSERPSFHVRIGGGAFLGSLEDARSFKGTASDHTSFRVGVVTETHSARLIYVDSELRMGLPLSSNVEVGVGIAIRALARVSELQWGRSPTQNTPHLVFAGNDRSGTFLHEDLMENVIFLFTPGIGARYDF
ncbi:MAG: PEGA domain-containing protein [Byssovorax sp.]